MRQKKRPDPDQRLKQGFHQYEAGRLSEAEEICRDILEGDPKNFDANYLLGTIAYETERFEVAATYLREATEINPRSEVSHHNLGLVHHETGDLESAVKSLRRALELKPDFVEAHCNLGIVLKDQGKLEDAVAAYNSALALKPDFIEALYNLGTVLADLGRPEEAVAVYNRALTLNPDFTETHYNLGVVLLELGKREEAVVAYRKAVALNPDLVDAHNNVGLLLNDLGRYGEAKAAHDEVLRVNYGGPWWNAATFADGDTAATVPLAEATPASTFKLCDAADQLEYLIHKGRIDQSFGRMVERYRGVLSEIQEKHGPEADIVLTPDQTERLGSFYNRVIHVAGAPRIDTGAVNSSLDYEGIENGYLSSPVSVTAFDHFLTPEALKGLRDFCLESTIFFNYTGTRFVSSKINNGFNCDILYQMVEELKERFPRVLGAHGLRNMWVYRYNNQNEGVAAHTDEGAVTFNFWITPDEANETPDAGGLVVYAKDQPYDWDWRRYNDEKYTPAVKREIADFLADAENVIIPYRENRVVLFHSNLFHKSEPFRFKDGFENRRMNVTLLFGERRA